MIISSVYLPLYLSDVCFVCIVYLFIHISIYLSIYLFYLWRFCIEAQVNLRSVTYRHFWLVEDISKNYIYTYGSDYCDYIRYGCTTGRFGAGAYLIHNVCSNYNLYNSFLFVRCNGWVDGDVYSYVWFVQFIVYIM